MRPTRSERRVLVVWRWMLRFGVLAYLVLLAYLSLRAVGQTSFDRVVDSVGRAYLHVPAYAGLAALLCMLPKTRRGIAPFALATAYGWMLEVAQIAAPTRTFNLLGLGLDAAGAILGWLVGGALLRYRLSRGGTHPATGGDRWDDRQGP